MDAPAEMPFRRRINPMSALMSAVTVASLIGAAWLRFAAPPSPGSQVVAVGAQAPLLWLLDLETSDPLVLVGLKGRVVWVVFWSADAPSGRFCLPELAAVWKGLKAHQQFALVTAAVETGDPGRVRAAVAAIGVDVPVYLASPETQRRFGAQSADPPLHVLIDTEGRVIAMARGAGSPTIKRIADLARRRLDELGPVGPTRFASAEPRPSDPAGLLVAND